MHSIIVVTPRVYRCFGDNRVATRLPRSSPLNTGGVQEEKERTCVLRESEEGGEREREKEKRT